MSSETHFAKKFDLDTRFPHQQYVIQGQYCTIQTARWDVHSESLFENLNDPELWTYVPPEDPIKSAKQFSDFFSKFPDQFYVIKRKGENDCIGLFSLLDAKVENQSVQLGYIIYSKKIQRSVITTQAFYLITSYVFDTLNFNRYYWKCNNLNQPSKNAATRFGFKFEGVLREVWILKKHYRDSAYFSILRTEWPSIKAEFERWLSKDNFDQDGKELTKLRLRQVRQQLDKDQHS